MDPFGGRDRDAQAREFARVYGSEARVAWVREQRSIVSGEGPCVNAHTKTKVGLPSGVARKGDFDTIVPLTWAEHEEMHRIGEDTFAERYGVDLEAEARLLEERWREYEDGLAW